jgi:hypothetical protein
LVTILAAAAFDFWNRPQPIGIDFHTYMAAALVGLRHGWSHIYDQGLVAAQQLSLAPHQPAQPFLSPPPLAWVTAGLAWLPLHWAYAIWAVASIGALAAAVAWTGSGPPVSRWLSAVVVVATMWVLQATYLGQVVPFLAAALVVTWRLLGEKRDIASGVLLGVVLLKPNTAFMVPLCLLVAGRPRVFAAWSLAASALGGLAIFTLGLDGLSGYVVQLQHPPPGTGAITLEAAFGVTGATAVALRAAIAGAAVLGAWRWRGSPGTAIALGVVSSLLITPYIHLADLALLAAVGWILWVERPQFPWRLLLAASWLVASPIVDLLGLGPTQNRWPLLELAWLVLVVLSRGDSIRGEQEAIPASRLNPA